jgi:hypothetical protein
MEVSGEPTSGKRRLENELESVKESEEKEAKSRGCIHLRKEKELWVKPPAGRMFFKVAGAVTGGKRKRKQRREKDSLVKPPAERGVGRREKKVAGTATGGKRGS